MTTNEIVKLAVKVMEDKKGTEIKVIDISKVSVIADYFIIAGGSNARQIKALADNVEEKLAELQVFPKSIEGYQNANWVLMDYADVIIHIFNQEERLFYDLERIWTDGQFVTVDELS